MMPTRRNRFHNPATRIENSIQELPENQQETLTKAPWGSWAPRWAEKLR
jgi:hypothetical protein